MLKKVYSKYIEPATNINFAKIETQMEMKTVVQTKSLEI